MLRLARHAGFLVRYEARLKSIPTPGLAPHRNVAFNIPNSKLLDVKFEGDLAHEYKRLLESSGTMDDAFKVFLGAKLQPEFGGEISIFFLRRLLKFTLNSEEKVALRSHPACKTLCKVFALNHKFLSAGDLAEIAQLLVILDGGTPDLYVTLMEEAARGLGEMTQNGLASFLRVLRLTYLPEEKATQLRSNATEVTRKKLDTLSFLDGGRFAVEVTMLPAGSLSDEAVGKLLQKISESVEDISPRLLIPLLRGLHSFGEQGLAVARPLVDHAKANEHLYTPEQMKLIDLVLTQQGLPPPQPRMMQKDFVALSTLRDLANETSFVDNAHLGKALASLLPRLRELRAPVITLLSQVLVRAKDNLSDEVKEEFVRGFLDYGKDHEGWRTYSLMLCFNRSMELLPRSSSAMAKELVVWANKKFPANVEESDVRQSVRMVKNFLAYGFFGRDVFSAVAKHVEKHLETNLAERDVVTASAVPLIAYFRSIHFLHEGLMGAVAAYFSKEDHRKDLPIWSQLSLISNFASLNYDAPEMVTALINEVS